MWRRKFWGPTKIVYNGIEMDLGSPFERITMVDAVKKYAGIDWNEVETLEQQESSRRNTILNLKRDIRRVIS